MGWVSCLEDVIERFDEAAFLLGKPELAVGGASARAGSTLPDANQASKRVGELGTILRGLKAQLHEALDYLTDPSTPTLDLDPAALRRLKEENRQLASRLARETAEREALANELRRTQVKLVGSTVQERDSSEKLEFLRAIGGQRLLGSRNKNGRR